MDRPLFRHFLEERNFSQERIESFIAFAEQFDKFCKTESRIKAFADFSMMMMMMIIEGLNTFDNYYALALHGRILKDNAFMLAALELAD